MLSCGINETCLTAETVQKHHPAQHKMKKIIGTVLKYLSVSPDKL